MKQVNARGVAAGIALKIKRSSRKRMPIDLQWALDNLFQENIWKALAQVYQQDGYLAASANNINYPIICSFTDVHSFAVDNLLYTSEYSNLNKLTINKKIPLNGFFYTFRLTYIDPITKQKFYYMGWRTGGEKDPREDNYFSSSEIVKNLIKEQGVQNFSKKIIGVYSTKEEAITHEIKTLRVFKSIIMPD